MCVEIDLYKFISFRNLFLNPTLLIFDINITRDCTLLLSYLIVTLLTTDLSETNRNVIFLPEIVTDLLDISLQPALQAL